MKFIRNGKSEKPFSSKRRLGLAGCAMLRAPQLPLSNSIQLEDFREFHLLLAELINLNCFDEFLIEKAFWTINKLLLPFVSLSVELDSSNRLLAIAQLNSHFVGRG